MQFKLGGVRVKFDNKDIIMFNGQQLVVQLGAADVIAQPLGQQTLCALVSSFAAVEVIRLTFKKPQLFMMMMTTTRAVVVLPGV